MFATAVLATAASIGCGPEDAQRTAETAETADETTVAAPSDTRTEEASDVAETGEVDPVRPPTPRCEPALEEPPASCPEGTVATQLWCEDPPVTGTTPTIGHVWICDAAGVDGDACRDGMYYSNRPCASGFECVTELYVSNCRSTPRTLCASAADCIAGERCFGFKGPDLHVCAPAQGLLDECTPWNGGDSTGTTAEAIQGSCGDGLRCMNIDQTGDSAKCLPGPCQTDADCGDRVGWLRARCISEAEAGPGRVAGCAFVAPAGMPCASFDTPHNGQACAEGSVCGDMGTDEMRRCVSP